MRVPFPASARISAVEPMAAMRFPRIATASAVGWASSIVWTEALMMTRSGASDEAFAGAGVVSIVEETAMTAARVFIGRWFGSSEWETDTAAPGICHAG